MKKEKTSWKVGDYFIKWYNNREHYFVGQILLTNSDNSHKCYIIHDTDDFTNDNWSNTEQMIYMAEHNSGTIKITKSEIEPYIKVLSL